MKELQVHDWILWLRQHFSGDWEPVTGGESDAYVFRSNDGSRYAKCVAAKQQNLLEQERSRVDWLSTTGILGPKVLDWDVDVGGASLVTSAVPGVSADSLSPDALDQAWPSIVDAVRTLHAVSATECPFSRNLTQMFVAAQDVVARGKVNPEFLPVDQQQTPPSELLAQITNQVDHRLSQEATDTVVCHGDLCLPNIILDPNTLSFSGFIDLGRLGLADRYADIALLLANAREIWDEREAVIADEVFARRYGITIDEDRQQFYLHLDPLTWG